MGIVCQISNKKKEKFKRRMEKARQDRWAKTRQHQKEIPFDEFKRRLNEIRTPKIKKKKFNKKPKPRIPNKNILPTCKAEWELEYQTNEWRIRRKDILKRDNFKCTQCEKTKDLHVHHLIYDNHLHVWEYESQHLVTLCDTCHKAVHDVKPIKEFYNKGKMLKRYSIYSKLSSEIELKPRKFKVKTDTWILPKTNENNNNRITNIRE